MFDIFRTITLTQQIFSVGSSPDPPISKKITVRSSPDPAKIDFSSDPVLIRAHLCPPEVAGVTFSDSDSLLFQNF